MLGLLDRATNVTSHNTNPRLFGTNTHTADIRRMVLEHSVQAHAVELPLLLAGSGSAPRAASG
jgi:hypothetical protein